MRVGLLVLQLILLMQFVMGCGGSSSSSSSPATPPSTPPSSGGIAVSESLGLVSGGTGLVRGSGVSGVTLVGVSGTGLAVGVSGTGLSIGTIQGFGSIFINDQRITTVLAEFELEGQAGSQTDLRQGQQVLIVGDLTTAEAQKVLYRANIIAALDSITVTDPILELGSATLLGQEIKLNAATAYEATELALLAIGSLVEISGIVDANGVLTATFVRQLSSASTYKLVGEASQVTDSNFEINGRSITYDSSVLDNFEDDTLTENDVVEIKFDAAQIGGPSTSLTAQSVELMPRLIVSESSQVSAEGVVDTFVSDIDFTIQNQPISTSNATTFINGSADTLAAGVRLLAIGSVDANGTLGATEIYFESDDTVIVEGPLEAVDLTNNTITVLSITFNVRNLTDFDDIDGLDDLQIGDIVEVAGYIDGQTNVAADIEREDALETGAELRGPTTEFDAATGSFSIFDIQIQTDEIITTFKDFDEQEVTQAEFFALLNNQVFISVEWDQFNSTSDIPTEISLEDD